MRCWHLFNTWATTHAKEKLPLRKERGWKWQLLKQNRLKQQTQLMLVSACVCRENHALVELIADDKWDGCLSLVHKQNHCHNSKLHYFFFPQNNGLPSTRGKSGAHDTIPVYLGGMLADTAMTPTPDFQRQWDFNVNTFYNCRCAEKKSMTAH